MNLSKNIDNVFGKAPLFEIPLMQYSPIRESVSFDGSPSSRWETIQKMISNRYARNLPLKEMMFKKRMNESIYDKM